jgi:hypothetical protein
MIAAQLRELIVLVPIWAGATNAHERIRSPALVDRIGATCLACLGRIHDPAAHVTVMSLQRGLDRRFNLLPQLLPDGLQTFIDLLPQLLPDRVKRMVHLLQ